METTTTTRRQFPNNVSASILRKTFQFCNGHKKESEREREMVREENKLSMFWLRLEIVVVWRKKELSDVVMTQQPRMLLRLEWTVLSETLSRIFNHRNAKGPIGFQHKILDQLAFTLVSE